MGVATAIAVGGLAMTATTTAMSFAQAGDQKRRQRQAEADAQKAMDAAKEKLKINYTDELAIKKEPYELQRDAALSAGAQAIQAGVESERGAAATAGKVQMAQNEAQAGIRTAMGNELTDIQNKQVTEQSRLRDLGAQIDLGEVAGQQEIAANAEEAATTATNQGFQGLVSLGQQGLNMMPLYFKDSSGQETIDRGGLTAAPASAKGLKPASSIMAPMPTAKQLQGRNPIGGTTGGFFPQTQSYYGYPGFNFSGVGGY